MDEWNWDLERLENIIQNLLETTNNRNEQNFAIWYSAFMYEVIDMMLDVLMERANFQPNNQYTQMLRMIRQLRARVIEYEERIIN